MRVKVRKILLISLVLSVLLCTICCSAAVISTGEEGMKFDGLAEYKTASVTMPLPTTYEATVSFPADFGGSGGVIYGSYTADDTTCFNFEVYSGGAPRIYVIDASGVKYDVIFDNVNVYTGTKTHIAIALDREAGAWTCYVNGKAAQTVSAAIPAQADLTAKFVLGGDNLAGNAQYFKGELFGVSLYGDKRSADEIALDASGSEIDTDGLIAAYAALSQENEEASITAMGDTAYNITYSCNWIKDVPDPEEYAYSFAVIGDIQSMTYYYPELLVKQFEWIRDNKDEKKIAFSIGLGDITEKNTDAEYQKVIESYNKIDGVVPFSIIRGNHERTSDNSTAMYDKYITYERYGDEITGSMDDTMHNTYRIIKIGKVKYMFMNLDLVLSDEAIEWANEIIAEHPECHVIVSTHAYKNMGGSYLTLATSGKFGVQNDSVVLWDRLLSQHENIVMMLYGHSPKDTIWKKQRNDTVHGNTVTEMLINPSETDKNYGGGGFIAMFYFSEDGEQLDVRYYSTAKDAFFMSNNQFHLTLDTPGVAEFTDVIMNVGADQSERNLTWYSQYDTEGEVRYAKSANGTLPEVYSTVPAVAVKATKPGYYSYKATMTGLEANSTYVYQLVVGGTASECYTFKVYGMGDDFSFAFVTDPQVKQSAHSILWDDTLNKIKTQFGEVSIIVSGGDQTSEPSSEDNFDWFISKHLSSLAIATTVGPPHDNSQLYQDHYNLPNLSSMYGVSTPSSDYFYTYNNVLFMHLNVENKDYDGHIKFMENAIADNPECTWRVVLLHFSFFTGGNHSTDGSVIAFREALAGKFNELDVDLVLSGHDHVYSRSRMMLDGYTLSGDTVTDGSVTDPNGTLYVCGTSATGSGWYSIEHSNDDAYIAKSEDTNRKSIVIFTVSEGALTLKAYFIDGDNPELFDTFTINKTEKPSAQIADAYNIKFVPLPGAEFGDSTDLSVFSARRFTAASPDAPALYMPKGSIRKGELYNWVWEYYLVGGDGAPVTSFEYGKSYIAYPVSTSVPVASTIYISTSSIPEEYTYTWAEAWDIVMRCAGEQITLTLKSDVTLTADDAVSLVIPVDLTLDLGGKRLDTSALAPAIKFAVGSNGSTFKVVTTAVGGTLNAGTSDFIEIGTNQGSTVTIQYGSSTTEALTVESVRYLVGANGNFKYTSTLNLSVIGGNYTIAAGVVYVSNVTTSAGANSPNVYKLDLKNAEFNFLGKESAIVRAKAISYHANSASYINAEGCVFTDTYKADHSSSRFLIREDCWYGTASFADCDFVGMSIGADCNGAALVNSGAITIGKGCTFTNSNKTFNTANPLAFFSEKVVLAGGCVLARTDAKGSVEALAASEAAQITWANPVGYTEYWKRGVVPTYLGETSFTVDDVTYSLVLAETPTVADGNKSYAFKSEEGYLYRYDNTGEVWQISTDGGNTYVNIGEAGTEPEPEPDPAVGCTVTVDGASTTYPADTDFYSVLASVNTSSHAGKVIKITLGADMSFKTKPTYNRAATLEIDLAGHKLTYEASGKFQIGATKLHIYSSVEGGELVFGGSGDGLQPVGGAIVFGSEEYKNNLTVSAVGELLAPKQTANGKTLHYEFLYCTVNFGASNLIRVNAIGAGVITLEMKIEGCTVNGDKSVICYNYTSTLGATTNGGVCNVNSYIDVIDTNFVCTADAPLDFFGSPNFTDRYFGTVSFEGTTFDNYVLNGDLIRSDEALDYNSYFTTLTGYDPTKTITIGEGCEFKSYGTTFTEALDAFAASNVSLAEGCVISAGAESVKIVSDSVSFGCILEVDGVSTTYPADTDFTSVLQSVNTSAYIGKVIKITLGADMTFKTKLTYNRAATVEIDLAGHKLTYDADGRFQVGATKLHIYSSVEGGELVFGATYGDGIQPSGGAIVFGSEEYKNNLTVSAKNEILNPSQTADGRTLHYEFLYCTVNVGANSLIRINAKGAGVITFEMKIVGCTVSGNKSVICYNFSTNLAATTNGGVCGTGSYIDVIDTTFICTADAPVGFFGSPNFTDRYFGTVSFEGTTFDNYVLNGELIYSDEALSYNTYFTTLTGYDPTKAITVGKGCVFNSYGATFTEDMKDFSAKNVSVAEGYEIRAEDGSVRIAKTLPTPPSIGTVSVTVSSSLAMNYTVTLPSGCDAAMLMMEFTMNGRTFTVYPTSVAEGTVTFVFTRIAPQCMGDSIGAVLYYDGEVVDTHGGYSVKAYAEDLLGLYGDNEQITRLVIDMLNYGAAAQAYVGYKTDTPVNSGLNGAGSTDTPTESDRVSGVTSSTNANYGFSAAGVRFDYVNKIFVKLEIAAGAPAGDAVTVLFDGVEAEVRSIGEGEYIAYSEGISALDFGKTVTVTLNVNGETVQTLTYSVNSYVYAKHSGTGAMADLALALYRYGLSAVAYEESVK